MLMEKASIFWVNTPFRKCFLNYIIRKYYSDHFGELKNKTVLEIGCGAGFGAELICQYFTPKKIISTDLDKRLINLAKKNVSRKEISFEVADATKLEYENNTFNAIFVFGMIHHLPYPEWQKCLRESFRVLKIDGWLFLYDLSIEHFTKSLYGKIIKLTTVHPYSKMYRKVELIDYLIRVGFKIEKNVEVPRGFVIIAKKQEYN